MSTTTEYTVGQRFSENTGVVLELKAAANALGDIKKTPKYIDVSQMSAFKNEQEHLFYGSNLAFVIVNIHETDSGLQHKRELQLLNLFQRVVLNENWLFDD